MPVSRNTTPDLKEPFTRCVQVGVVVKDLERSIRYLTEVFGIGPFRTIDWPPAGRTDLQRFYHGQPGNFTARMAFADLGSVELELIQPVTGESVWTDFLKEHGEGIHHIRFNTFDMEPLVQYLASHDVGVSQTGSGLRLETIWTYFDTQDKVGFVIEVLKAVPGTDGRTPNIVGGKVQAS
jgi:methylmalonyl-CoA/ethylmalonyl-CoA epimerase